MSESNIVSHATFSPLGDSVAVSPELLLSFRIFEGLGRSDAVRLGKTLTRMSFDPGSTILHEGKSIQALWIILSGDCVVTRTANDNAQMTLAALRSGDVFGEMSFVRTAPHSASIMAGSAVTVCTFTREDFLTLSSERPAAAFRIASNIAGVLAERLRRMDNWICELVDRPDAESHRDEWQKFRSAVYTNWSF
jgi:CRP/FNR family transcriptional regulator, cyclic AMP receptor protein